MSVVGSVVYSLSVTNIAGWDKTHNGVPEYLLFYLFFGVPICIFGLLLTPLSLALTSTSPTCFNICYSCSRVEYGALVPSKPHSHYVLDGNGKPSLVPQYEEKKPEEEKREEFELDNNKGGETAKTQDGEMVDNQIWTTMIWTFVCEK